MSKKTVLVCDDHPQIARDWRTRIAKVCPRDFVPESFAREELLEAVGQLERRRKEARKARRARRDCGEVRFDKADILVIDYDLLDLAEGAYVTGEDVAYLARCYSTCGLIIGLNQYGTNDFDLTLRGHPESFADLNLGGDQIGNSGLWTSKWEGFRPSHWPVLPTALEAYEQRVRNLKKNLDTPILSYLGFNDREIQSLPRSAKEFLARKKGVTRTTFRDFVTPPGNGLRAKDKPTDDESIARIAAARVWKWVERIVLSGQDILVDAPHLVSRFPSLLKGTPRRLESWNRTSSFQSGEPTGIDAAKLSKCQFRRPEWLSRPAWFWKCVSATRNIAEVDSPWDKEDFGFVFCEDISRFLPRSATRAFVADLPSPFVQRFVSDPSSRECRRFASSLQGINYQPKVRFSF